MAQPLIISVHIPLPIHQRPGRPRPTRPLPLVAHIARHLVRPVKPLHVLLNHFSFLRVIIVLGGDGPLALLGLRDLASAIVGTTF